MFGYPFQYIYLKSELSRRELEQRLLNVTFLSDANFKKQSQNPSVFFGEVSNIDFNLEHISKKQQGVNFVRGQFLGADNEMYTRVRLGAWQNQRIYFLLIAMFLTLFGFLVHYVSQAPHGFRYPEEYYQLYGYNSSELAYNLKMPLALIMQSFMAIIAIIMLVKFRNFRKSMNSTIQYLKGLWDAELITKHEVPLLFR